MLGPGSQASHLRTAQFNAKSRSGQLAIQLTGAEGISNDLIPIDKQEYTVSHSCSMFD